MNEEGGPSVQFDATLASTLNHHLGASEYAAALAAVKDNRYTTSLLSNISDTINVLLIYLTDENFNTNPALFMTCENILKIIAELVHPQDALFELLEIVETTSSDNIFTSTLKALQICLLRQKDHKARSLEWCLNSILTYIGKLTLSESLRTKIEAEEEKLLEENAEIQRIITNYLTLFLFYEPIHKELMDRKTVPIFRDVRINRRNVFGCFLLQLLGRPLYYLDLSYTEGTNIATNTYSRQCAETLVRDFCALFPDPFFLLPYIERRIRFPITFKQEEGVYEGSPRDIFIMDEKLPLDAVGTFYYLILVENLMPDSCPQVYNHLYLFEMGLYVLSEQFKFNENCLHAKAIKLGTKLLEHLQDDHIPITNLELNIHEQFCTGLLKVIIQSSSQRNSQNAVLLLKKYIFQFNDDGRFLIITKLFAVVEHNALTGYLVSLYKNMIAEALDSMENQLFSGFCGAEFFNIMTKYICHLKNGCETDLIQNSDHIISSLNMLRYLSMRDRLNRTGFWTQLPIFVKNFLEPLRTDIDMSRAHYKLEDDQLKLSGKTDDFKSQMLTNALNTFDLIDSLLSRVNECIRNVPE